MILFTIHLQKYAPHQLAFSNNLIDANMHECIYSMINILCYDQMLKSPSLSKTEETKTRNYLVKGFP